jgi:hypothetical protein
MERDGDGYKAMIRLLDAFGHGQFSTFNLKIIAETKTNSKIKNF